MTGLPFGRPRRLPGRAAETGRGEGGARGMNKRVLLKMGKNPFFYFCLRRSQDHGTVKVVVVGVVTISISNFFRYMNYL